MAEEWEDAAFELGIDCGPGEARPDFYFPKVLRGTGLKVSDFELISRMFGAWIWRLRPGQEREARFLAARHKLFGRLKKLVDEEAESNVRGALLRPGPHEILLGEAGRWKVKKD